VLILARTPGRIEGGRRLVINLLERTLKAWMGATHFKTRTLEKVRTEMSLHVLAYNPKHVIAILGAQPLMKAMRARGRASKAHASQQVRRNRQSETASQPTIRRSRICVFTQPRPIAEVLLRVLDDRS
jgi:hypothetical protein